MSSGQRFLVDTSAWVETLRKSGDAVIRARVSEATADDRAVLCDMVRVELWNGARDARDQKLLREIEEQLQSVPTTPEVWARARDLARLARAKGVTVPAADLLIAACAQQHQLQLIHNDTHFDKLETLESDDL
ncbi:MAG: PIN domain-containing protein [Acidobacteriota bacterium]